MYAYTVDVFDIFTLENTTTIARAADSILAALNLMAHGYVAKSSTRPTIIIRLRRSSSSTGYAVESRQ